MKKVRIYLADDHTILRDGLKVLLNNEKNLEVIGENGDGQKALSEIEKLLPDIVILDISMPGMTGVEITRQIKKYFPKIKIVILSRHDNEVYIEQLISYGIEGYVLKENAVSDLTRAVNAAIKGNVYISPEITNKILPQKNQPKDKTIYEQLSDREREVLKLLAEGHSNKEIASLLWISVSTVKSHRLNIMKKIDIHNLADLTLFAVKNGLIET